MGGPLAHRPRAVNGRGDRDPVGPAEALWVPVNVRIPPEAAAQAGPGAHPLVIRIESLGPAPAAIDEKTTFMVPR